MRKNVLTTPVLFLTFNRLKETKIVFEEIKKAKPKELFIASDGPREDKPNEKKLVLELRKYLLKSIDWNCKVKTLFRKKNIGCKYAVSGAIDWFFKHVEQGIILEDDCLPNQSFFRFCEEMLRKYKDDERIMHISGTNVEKISKIEESYFFATTVNVWGWATWKRAWKLYDVNVKNWPKFKKQGFMRHYTPNFIENLIHIRNMNNLYNGKIDTWDYQWSFCCLINNNLSIIPKSNLITNIGFTGGGTHMDRFDKSKMIQRFDLDFPLKDNYFFIDSKRYQKSARKFFYKGRISRRLLKILKK